MAKLGSWETGRGLFKALIIFFKSYNDLRAQMFLPLRSFCQYALRFLSSSFLLPQSSNESSGFLCSRSLMSFAERKRKAVYLFQHFSLSILTFFPPPAIADALYLWAQGCNFCTQQPGYAERLRICHFISNGSACAFFCVNLTWILPKLRLWLWHQP